MATETWDVAGDITLRYQKALDGIEAVDKALTQLKSSATSFNLGGGAAGGGGTGSGANAITRQLQQVSAQAQKTGSDLDKWIYQGTEKAAQETARAQTKIFNQTLAEFRATTKERLKLEDAVAATTEARARETLAIVAEAIQARVAQESAAWTEITALAKQADAQREALTKQRVADEVAAWNQIGAAERQFRAEETEFARQAAVQVKALAEERAAAEKAAWAEVIAAEKQFAVEDAEIQRQRVAAAKAVVAEEIRLQAESATALKAMLEEQAAFQADFEAELVVNLKRAAAQQKLIEGETTAYLKDQTALRVQNQANFFSWYAAAAKAAAADAQLANAQYYANLRADDEKWLAQSKANLAQWTQAQKIANQQAASAAKSLAAAYGKAGVYATALGPGGPGGFQAGAVTSDLPKNLQGLAQTAQGVKRIGTEAKETTGWLAKMKDTILAFAIGYLAISVLFTLFKNLKGAIVDFNASQEQVMAGLRTQLDGNAKVAERLRDNLRRLNDISSLREEEIIGNAQRLLAATKDWGTAAQRAKIVEDAMRGINEQVAALGGGAAQFNSIGTALQQIATKPKLSLEELNQQLAETGVNAFPLLARAYKTNTAQIQEWIKKGLIPGKEAFLALTNQMALTNWGAMQEQAKTFTGQLSTLADRLNRSFGTAFKNTFEALKRAVTVLNVAVTDPRFQHGLQRFADILQSLAVKIIPLLIAGLIVLTVQLVRATVVGLIGLTVAANKTAFALTTKLVPALAASGTAATGFGIASVAAFTIVGAFVTGLILLFPRMTQKIAEWEDSLSRFFGGQGGFAAATKSALSGPGLLSQIFGFGDFEQSIRDAMGRADALMAQYGQKPKVYVPKLGETDPSKIAEKVFKETLRHIKTLLGELAQEYEKFGSLNDSLLEKLRATGEQSEATATAFELTKKAFDRIPESTKNAERGLAGVVDKMKAISELRDKTIDSLQSIEKRMMAIGAPMGPFYALQQRIERHMNPQGTLRKLFDTGQKMGLDIRAGVAAQIDVIRAKRLEVDTIISGTHAAAGSPAAKAAQAAAGGARTGAVADNRVYNLPGANPQNWGIGVLGGTASAPGGRGVFDSLPLIPGFSLSARAGSGRDRALAAAAQMGVTPQGGVGMAPMNPAIFKQVLSEAMKVPEFAASFRYYLQGVNTDALKETPYGGNETQRAMAEEVLSTEGAAAQHRYAAGLGLSGRDAENWVKTYRAYRMAAAALADYNLAVADAKKATDEFVDAQTKERLIAEDATEWLKNNVYDANSYAAALDKIKAHYEAVYSAEVRTLKDPMARKAEVDRREAAAAQKQQAEAGQKYLEALGESPVAVTMERVDNIVADVSSTLEKLNGVKVNQDSLAGIMAVVTSGNEPGGLGASGLGAGLVPPEFIDPLIRAADRYGMKRSDENATTMVPYGVAMPGEASKLPGESFLNAKALRDSLVTRNEELELQTKVTELARQEARWARDDAILRAQGLEPLKEEVALREQIRELLKKEAFLEYNRILQDTQKLIFELKDGTAQADLKFRLLYGDLSVLNQAMKDQLLSDAMLRDKLEKMKAFTDNIKGIFQGAFEDAFKNGPKGFFKRVIGGIKEMLDNISAQILTSQVMRLLGPLFGKLGVQVVGQQQQAEQGAGGIFGSVFGNILGGMFGHKGSGAAPIPPGADVNTGGMGGGWQAGESGIVGTGTPQIPANSRAWNFLGLMGGALGGPLGAFGASLAQILLDPTMGVDPMMHFGGGGASFAGARNFSTPQSIAAPPAAGGIAAQLQASRQGLFGNQTFYVHTGDIRANDVNEYQRSITSQAQKSSGNQARAAARYVGLGDQRLAGGF